jgi:hypothetical protein
MFSTQKQNHSSFFIFVLLLFTSFLALLCNSWTAALAMQQCSTNYELGMLPKPRSKSITLDVYIIREISPRVKDTSYSWVGVGVQLASEDAKECGTFNSIKSVKFKYFV